MTDANAAAIISIQDVTKRFGASVTAVDRVSLDIREGEFFALLGPSGCGKTTLLRMIAGFESPSQGEIVIDGEPMTGVEPNKRPINMVFQSYAVFPHMTVAENIAYGLRVVGTPRGDIDQRVEEAIGLVRLQGLEDRKPDKLSGGQRQRVALARALVKKPKVLLLDEPLSALDAKLRETMQLELVRLQQSVGITFIIVTHDQSEALSMADRIAVMGDGKVLQVAPPLELYEYPSSTFVADFIGQVNIFPVTGQNTTSGSTMVEVPALGSILLALTEAGLPVKNLALRPEKIEVTSEEPQDETAIRVRAVLRDLSYNGDQSQLYLEAPDGTMISARVQNRDRGRGTFAERGESLWLAWRPEDMQPLAE